MPCGDTGTGCDAFVSGTCKNINACTPPAEGETFEPVCVGNNAVWGCYQNGTPVFDDCAEVGGLVSRDFIVPTSLKAANVTGTAQLSLVARIGHVMPIPNVSATVNRVHPVITSMRKVDASRSRYLWKCDLFW